MADPASDARHRRVASLGRLDHAVEGIAQAGVVVTVAVGGPAFEERRDDRQLIVDPLLSDEHVA